MTSCSAPQRYSEQADVIAMPVTWTAADISMAAPTGQRLYQNWLEEFDDPQLARLIEIALQHSGGLIVARLEAEAAALDVQATQTQLWPQLDFVLGASRDRAASGAASNRIATTKEYQVELAASWELDIWGKNRSQVTASERALERALELAQSARLSLVGLVAKAWLTLLALEQQREIDERRVASFADTERSIFDQVARGLKGPRDLDVARAELHQARADAEVTLRQRNVQRNQLQILLGTHQEPELDPTVGLPKFVADWRLDAPVTHLLARPDLRASFLAIEQADAEVAAAYAARFPQFTLTANVGRTAARISDLSNGISAVSTVAANLIVPLIDATNRKLNQQRQERLAEIAATRFRDDLLRAFHEVEETVGNEELLQEEIRALSEAVVWAERSDRTSLSSYRRGLIGVADLLEARRTKLDLQRRLIDAKRELFVNRVNIYLALGGEPKASTSQTGV